LKTRAHFDRKDVIDLGCLNGDLVPELHAAEARINSDDREGAGLGVNLSLSSDGSSISGNDPDFLAGETAKLTVSPSSS
jgi:hypothetical protein